MAITPIALKAYQTALQSMNTGLNESKQKSGSITQGQDQDKNFAEAITDSVKQVNELQKEKGEMIKSFASGEEQNVHELMITLQKAGLAMSMTSAVRSKVMEAYKELMHMSF